LYHFTDAREEPPTICGSKVGGGNKIQTGVVVAGGSVRIDIY